MCAWRRPGQTEDRKARCLVRMPEGAHLIHILPWWTVIKVFIIAFLHMCGQINSILWYIVCRPTINSGGHYEVTFNALRHRALGGFNDRSHGTNLDCWLDNPKQAIIMYVYWLHTRITTSYGIQKFYDLPITEQAKQNEKIESDLNAK